MPTPNEAASTAIVGSQPLYAQVRQRLVQRISTGEWRPGQLIPNEFELAKEMGVSQGTARKALDSLASDGLLVRRQGRGTFVVEHTPSDMLFRFFNLFDETGAPIVPNSIDARVALAKATAAERKQLRLGPNANVIRISRIRTRLDRPFIVETLALPASRFGGLERQTPIPIRSMIISKSSLGLQSHAAMNAFRPCSQESGRQRRSVSTSEHRY